ncbi:MAG: thiolase family protein [Candidatus Tectomicrobia bacterium]|uniref:propanoyl-CoA C-acyltransferase n=1 Tax=Tectimicrobiota bacterium TaxID=2528274 RepID=A0A932GN58_UNCTE|nr:thiolase family protein [Candidatus Tectomicrobia bacterium]
MEKVGIVGVGMHRFGKFPNLTLTEMGVEACVQALRDSGLDKRRIGACVVGNVGGGMVPGQKVLAELGLAGIPLINVENACASAGTALHVAWSFVASGRYEAALALGLEQMSRTIEGTIPLGGDSLELQMGMMMPGKFALVARKHMELYRTSLQQLAAVSVKNHRHGALNPLAQYRKEFTVEEVLSSPLIADPLTLLQCSPTGDGAAAVVLCSAREAARASQPIVWIEASVLTSGTYEVGPRDMTSYDQTRRAAAAAYEAAGCGPEEIDVVEVHDGFTISEIIHSEDLGFFPKGEGGPAAESGATAIGGRIPINPSGGLLARGHPIGATGLAQIAELVWQLRGQAGSRQVDGAKVGLAHCMGGLVQGLDAAACTVHILKC